MNDVDRFHNRAAWVFIILIFGSMMLGCAQRYAVCKDWNSIQKESRYASFYCLNVGPDKFSRCTRREDHREKHHAHSLDGRCLSWR